MQKISKKRFRILILIILILIVTIIVIATKKLFPKTKATETTNIGETIYVSYSSGDISDAFDTVNGSLSSDATSRICNFSRNVFRNCWRS